MIIFVGEAVQAGSIDGSVNPTFEVIESFTPRPVVGSIVAATNGLCGGIPYETGKRYLIYGGVFPSVPYGELLEIGSCRGTREIDQAELTYVREWTRMNPYSQNRLSGTLVDLAGKPVSNVRVDLIANDGTESRPGRFGYTDNTGRFDFAKVLPGEYVLGINIDSGPLSYQPYPTLYFPGVENRRDAVIIRMFASEELDGFEFVLPERYPTREISVRIRWWDGTPVTNAQIICRIGQAYNYERETRVLLSGREGTAKVEILATDHFEIAILDLLWRSPTPLQSPPETVPEVPVIHGEPGLKNAEVTFVISRSHDQRNLLTPLIR